MWMPWQKKTPAAPADLADLADLAMDNLPAGPIDWAGLSDFILDMLDSKYNGSKGWKIVSDPAMTQGLPENSVLVLKLLHSDLYEGVFPAARRSD